MDQQERRSAEESWDTVYHHFIKPGILAIQHEEAQDIFDHPEKVFSRQTSVLRREIQTMCSDGYAGFLFKRIRELLKIYLEESFRRSHEVSPKDILNEYVTQGKKFFELCKWFACTFSDLTERVGYEKDAVWDLGTQYYREIIFYRAMHVLRAKCIEEIGRFPSADLSKVTELSNLVFQIFNDNRKEYNSLWSYPIIEERLARFKCSLEPREHGCAFWIYLQSVVDALMTEFYIGKEGLLLISNREWADKLSTQILDAVSKWLPLRSCDSFSSATTTDIDNVLLLCSIWPHILILFTSEFRVEIEKSIKMCSKQYRDGLPEPFKLGQSSLELEARYKEQLRTGMIDYIESLTRTLMLYSEMVALRIDNISQSQHGNANDEGPLYEAFGNAISEGFEEARLEVTTPMSTPEMLALSFDYYLGFAPLHLSSLRGKIKHMLHLCSVLRVGKDFSSLYGELLKTRLETGITAPQYEQHVIEYLTDETFSGDCQMLKEFLQQVKAV